MKRIAFKMKLKPGFIEEYRDRHDRIWPELTKLLNEVGVSDYSIYLDPDSLTLFAVQVQQDNYVGNNLSEHPIMKRWWRYMSDIMECNEDFSPKESLLEQVFYLP